MKRKPDRIFLMVNGSCVSDVDKLPWKDLPYLAWHDRADRYWNAGQRQKCCQGCSKWRWDDEPCCDAPRLTAKEDAAQTRAIVKAVKKQYPSSSERYRRELRQAMKEGRVIG